MSRTLHILFWISLSIESIVLVYLLFRAWELWSGNSQYEVVYPELYRKVLMPAGVLFIIVSAALYTRFIAKKVKTAFWISISPVWLYGLALAGMLVASIFIHDWR